MDIFNRCHYAFTYADFYKKYKKRCGRKGVVPLPKKDYIHIMTSLFGWVTDELLYKEGTFNIPHGLGCISITSDYRPAKNQPTDYITSKKLNKKILHTNNRSHRRVYRIEWIISAVSFLNRQYYKFKACDESRIKLYNKIVSYSEDPYKKLIK